MKLKIYEIRDIRSRRQHAASRQELDRRRATQVATDERDRQSLVVIAIDHA